MATTIKQSFEDYASNLNVTDKQEESVSTCRGNVVKTLKSELSLHPQESKLIGSYDRDTNIRYLAENDVDVMVILHYGKNKEWDNPAGTSASLNKFKEILSASYKDTEMRIDRNCVTMKLSKFSFDVVPAFRLDSGSYKIPDTHRRLWLPTNPVAFAEKITAVNKSMGGTFIPLIKMVKGWNRDNAFLIRSFHLECMLYEHYKTYTKGYTYNSTLNVFFSKLPLFLSGACYDPITGDRLDEYLDSDSQVTKRQIAVTRASIAAEISKKAEEYEKNYPDNPKYAIDEWKKLLGEFFPVYG